MNFSVDTNMSIVLLRDSLKTALTKNIIVVALSIIISYINGVMVHTFLRHEILNEDPRYMLFIHMVLNDIIQLMIAVMLHVFSYVFYTINVSFCCLLLMIAIFCTHSTPLYLASMAIECYIAVCYPLRHAQICTVRRTYVLIALIWTLGSLPYLLDPFVLLATEPLEFFRSTIFCIPETVFRHPILQQKKDITDMVYLVFVWCILIFSYLRILMAAKAAKSDSQKARNTIILHAVQLLMSMLTYLAPVIYNLLLYIFPKYILEVRFTTYLIVQILPRFLSPIIYGVRDQTFRKYLRKYFCNITVHNRDVSVSIRINPAKVQT
ncbi:odorant receptor 131-2-like [Brienomyrus brachyistius]|uniref:odorant receptor 131-2-like n=1 Tax=Brienomyrus brachyistius TaxID=42636 RepID=UPI0020B454C3|nr:odorant receptor 131-2-like [Brienomyrus brachyistius]